VSECDREASIGDRSKRHTRQRGEGVIFMFLDNKGDGKNVLADGSRRSRDSKCT
jgi:hypothetical protein